MMDKKAVELSINFIVILIISIIVFGLGLRFISKLSSEAVQLQELTASELDEMISSIICEGSQRVCVGIDRKTIKRTRFDVFGLKIINILENQNFDVIISRPTPPGYTKDKAEIPSDKLIWTPQQRSMSIEKNEEATIAIGIQVPADALSGTYIFDIIIQTQDGRLYSPVQKLYVDVP